MSNFDGLYHIKGLRGHIKPSRRDKIVFGDINLASRAKCFSFQGLQSLHRLNLKNCKGCS